MPVNPYFANVSEEQDQDLFEDLTIETIQISGINVKYIPREIFEIDPVLQEPRKTTFDRAFLIEVLPTDLGNYEGEQNIMAKFGFRLNQSSEFVMSKKRFAELGTGRDRPKEGDLIYVGEIMGAARSSFTNSLFEIKNVWYMDPSWQLGKNFVYRISSELFRYSYENINTGVENIDQFQIENEDEMDLGVNEDIVNEQPELIDFDKQNPFRNF